MNLKWVASAAFVVTIVLIGGWLSWRIGECFVGNEASGATRHGRYYASRSCCRLRWFRECGESKGFPLGVYLLFEGAPSGRLVANSSHPELEAVVMGWGLGPNDAGTMANVQRILQVETRWFLKLGVRTIQAAVWLERPTIPKNQGILCPGINRTRWSGPPSARSLEPSWPFSPHSPLRGGGKRASVGPSRERCWRKSTACGKGIGGL